MAEDARVPAEATAWTHIRCTGSGGTRCGGGYGLPVGRPLRGDAARRVDDLAEYGRDYRVGYALGMLDRDDVNFELGVDAQRREMPTQGEASNGVMGHGTIGW